MSISSNYTIFDIAFKTTLIHESTPVELNGLESPSFADWRLKISYTYKKTSGQAKCQLSMTQHVPIPTFSPTHKMCKLRVTINE
jgi:hypothetical protein